MSDLILMCLYYDEMMSETYLYEEYRMYEALLRDLLRTIESLYE